MKKNFFIVMTMFLLSSLTFAEKITISLVGDMCFDGKIEKRIEEFGGDFLFEGYREYINKSNIVIGNLETSVSKRGSAVQGKSYTFRSNPEIIKVLKKNRVKIVSIGNNHTLDYGVTAFKDTIKNLKKNGIGFSGGALNKSESNIFPYTVIKGHKIGFLAFSRVVPNTTWHLKEERAGVMGIYPFQEKEALELIKSAKKKCDILIVSLHCGKERSLYPGAEEKRLTRKVVDSGADIVMGHHTHTVQEYEYYKGKPIFYSLGNFIFTNSFRKECNKTVMAVLTVDEKGKVEKIKMVRGEIVNNMPLAYSGYIYKKMKNAEKKLAIKEKDNNRNKNN